MRLWHACVVWIPILVVGCGEGPPPLDELPLRDALRADPEVVAALPDDLRARLAARFAAAREQDSATDDVAGAGDDPSALIAAVDRARAGRDAEPLIVGAVSAGVARALPAQADDAAGPALPPFETAGRSATADAELAALSGNAGTAVRALMKASRASHLRRVTGWPTGAVAVGDTVYVNAAWLVALAPGGGRPDAGAGAVPVASGSVALAPSGVTTPSPATLAASTEQQSALASAAAAYGDPDGGISSYYPPTPPPPPPPPPPPEDGTTCWEACAAFSDACANTDSSGCDDGSNDSCDTTDDGSADSCESTSDDGSTESCNSTTDDGSTESCDSTTDDGSASSCQVARSRPAGRGRPTGREGREAWLFMPLGFLMVTGRQRRT